MSEWKKIWEQKARIAWDGFYESDIWRNMRYEVFRKYGQKCLKCGVAGHKKQLHVDHVKPKVRYPELALDIRNLQILCQDCNWEKAAKDETDWRSQ